MTPHTKYPYRLLGVIYTCLSQRDGIFLLWLHCNFLGIIDKESMQYWRACYKSGEAEFWYFSESQKAKR